MDSEYFDWLCSENHKAVLINLTIEPYDFPYAIAKVNFFNLMDWIMTPLLRLKDRWGNEVCDLIIPTAFLFKPYNIRYQTPQKLKVRLLN